MRQVGCLQELHRDVWSTKRQRFEFPTYGYVVNIAAEGMVCYLPEIKEIHV